MRYQMVPYGTMVPDSTIWYRYHTVWYRSTIRSVYSTVPYGAMVLHVTIIMVPYRLMYGTVPFGTA